MTSKTHIPDILEYLVEECVKEEAGLAIDIDENNYCPLSPVLKKYGKGCPFMELNTFMVIGDEHLGKTSKLYHCRFESYKGGDDIQQLERALKKPLYKKE